MAFTHNSNIAESEPSWDAVNKTKLPRMAFADHGEPGKKSTWKYPHHWVQNGGNEDTNGVYTTGTMYLHVGGWQAAINAAHGARSGEKASAGVQRHLEEHRPAINRHREHNAMSIIDPQCWANHMGFWCIEPLWMQQAITAIQSGIWVASSLQMESARQEEQKYELYENIAVIPLHGPMMKSPSKFGGVGTVETRRAIRQASHDPYVKTILLHIDSPGGHVAGTQELADEIYRVRSTEKQIIAHIDDLCASAAYWVASQTQHVTANITSEIGSIGTIAILRDASEKMEKEGIKVYVITTGPFKAVGVEGIPLSEDDLAYISQRVENLNTHFLVSVTRGRKKSKETISYWSDGKMHIARQAQKMGLIDGISSFEQVLEEHVGKRDILHNSDVSRGRHAQTLRLFRQRQGV